MEKKEETLENLEAWVIRIRQLRKQRDWTQEELADRSGISRATISQIESGRNRDLKDSQINALARGFGMSPIKFRQYIYDSYLLPVPDETPDELWEKYAASRPITVPVYPDFAKVHAGEAVEVVDYVYVARPPSTRHNIKAYIVHGDCLEPELRDGDYVIVDHSRQIDPGNKIVCLIDGELHIGILKVINGANWMANKYGNRRLEECQGAARVIGSYRPEP